jgi:hypothetical protein
MRVIHFRQRHDAHAPAANHADVELAAGQYWGIFVPQALHAPARAALEEQGITITPPPEPWAFAPVPRARRILKVLIVLVLLAVAGLAIVQLASLF